MVSFLIVLYHTIHEKITDFNSTKAAIFCFPEKLSTQIVLKNSKIL